MPTMSVLLAYRDVQAARDFFINALGFEEEWMVEERDGTISRSHLRLGEAELMIDGPGTHGVQSPHELGATTHLIVIGVDDVDAHHLRAAAAGATTDGPPQDEEWGGRAYMLTDAEGYIFQFYEVR